MTDIGIGIGTLKYGFQTAKVSGTIAPGCQNLYDHHARPKWIAERSAIIAGVRVRMMLAMQSCFKSI